MQVRCMAAVLLLVGQGREDPSVIASLLDVSARPCKPIYTLASEATLIPCCRPFLLQELEWELR